MIDTVAQPLPASPVPAYSARSFWTPILVFYAASVGLERFADGPTLTTASYVLGGAAGAAVVAASRWCNVWVLLTIGFAQYAIIAVPAALDSWVFLMATFSPRFPAQVAAACAAGGLVAHVIRERTLRRDVVSGAAWLEWVKPWRTTIGSMLDRVETVRKSAVTIMFIIVVAMWIWTRWR